MAAGNASTLPQARSRARAGAVAGACVYARGIERQPGGHDPVAHGNRKLEWRCFALATRKPCAEIIQRALAKAELQAPPGRRRECSSLRRMHSRFLLRRCEKFFELPGAMCCSWLLMPMQRCSPILRCWPPTWRHCAGCWPMRPEHKRVLLEARRACHWLRRFGGSRPLFVRVAAAGTLRHIDLGGRRRRLGIAAVVQTRSPPKPVCEVWSGTPAQEAAAMIAAVCRGDVRAGDRCFQAEIDYLRD